MNRVPSLARLAGLALASVLALAACSGVTGGGAASPPPTPPMPAATPVATPAVTPAATPVPSATPSGPLEIALDNATAHDVSIELLDEGRHVVAARSGHPGDGASVPFGSLEAKNLDARTVQFTWSDTPGDARLGLYVSENAKVVLVIRPDRAGGDAVAFDRILIVAFDVPVDASGLHLGVQEGLDTAG